MAPLDLLLLYHYVPHINPID